MKWPDPTTTCGDQELGGLSWLQSPLLHLSSEGYQPHTGLPSPVFQCQEQKFPQPRAMKTSEGCG